MWSTSRKIMEIEARNNKEEKKMTKKWSYHWTYLMISIIDMTATQLGLGWTSTQVSDCWVFLFPSLFHLYLGHLPPIALALLPNSSLDSGPGVPLCFRYYRIKWRSNLTPTRPHFHRTYSPPSSTTLTVISALELFQALKRFFWIVLM